MTHQAADAHSCALVDPPADAPIIAPERLRPGIGLEQIGRFSGDCWDLSPLDHKQTGSARTLRWTSVPEQLRPSLKRIAWAVINRPTPDVLLTRAGTNARPVIAAQTVLHASRTWNDLARWLVDKHVVSLDQVDPELLEDYARDVHQRGHSFGHARNKLFAVTRMWAYSPFLLPQDRICMPPWDNPVAELSDFLGEDDTSRGENTTAVIHPATMSPLLVWALRTVTDLAPDILAAWRERQRLMANLPAKAKPGRDREAQRRLHQYFAHLRDTGQSIPVYIGVAPNLDKGRTDEGRRSAISPTFIAATLGISVRQVSHFLEHFPDVLAGQSPGDGAPLDVPITATIDSEPWTTSIDFTEAKQLGMHLSTAALVTILYLSGMRPEEVLHLEHGCASREEGTNGLVRYRIHGRHFKGVTDEQGSTIPAGELRPEPWTVIELVHRAIAVVQQLSEGPLLFPRYLTTTPRDSKRIGDALSTNATRHRISAFTAWANTLAHAHGRAHEVIPPDPDGAVTVSRFRRTVAWFIYRRPGGRIALGLQYGHIGASMAEGYAGRSRFDMLEILDFEESLAMADNLSTAGKRIAAGEGLSGPAAHRYAAAAREYQASFEGSFLTTRQHRALMANPRLRVYEHAEAFLTCNHDPFAALCDPDRGRGRGGHQRTPSLDRCDRLCANISRTDTHIARAQAERQAIIEELADRINPLPIAQRLIQRNQKLETIISDHEATRILPTEPVQDGL